MEKYLYGMKRNGLSSFQGIHLKPALGTVGNGSLSVVDLYVLRSLLQGYATCYAISALR